MKKFLIILSVLILIQLAINFYFNKNKTNLVSKSEILCSTIENSKEKPINSNEIVKDPIKIDVKPSDLEDMDTTILEEVFDKEIDNPISSDKEKPIIHEVKEMTGDNSHENTYSDSAYNDIISKALARVEEKNFRDYLIDFNNESLAIDWADLMENNIKDFIFLRSNHLELNLDGISCASKSCQIRISSPNNLRTYIHSLFIDMAQENWWEFKKISAQDTIGHDGTIYTVYLLSPDISSNDN